MLEEENYSLYAPDLESTPLGPLAEIDVADIIGKPEGYNLSSNRAKKMRNLLGNYKGIDRYEIFENQLQRIKNLREIQLEYTNITIESSICDRFSPTGETDNLKCPQRM